MAHKNKTVSNKASKATKATKATKPQNDNEVSPPEDVTHAFNELINSYMKHDPDDKTLNYEEEYSVVKKDFRTISNIKMLIEERSKQIINKMSELWSANKNTDNVVDEVEGSDREAVDKDGDIENEEVKETKTTKATKASKATKTTKTTKAKKTTTDNSDEDEEGGWPVPLATTRHVTALCPSLGADTARLLRDSYERRRPPSTSSIWPIKTLSHPP